MTRSEEPPESEGNTVPPYAKDLFNRPILVGALSIAIGLMIGFITYWLSENWLAVTKGSFECDPLDFLLVSMPVLASPLVLLLAVASVLIGVRSIRGRHAHATVWGRVFTLIGSLVLGASALAYLIFTVQLLGGFLIVFIMCGGSG